jgi:hypothetical protein
MPKENNRQKGENSPNLVTLLPTVHPLSLVPTACDKNIFRKIPEN